MKTTNLNNLIDQLIDQQQLPSHYRVLVDQYLVPLSDRVAKTRQVKQAPMVLGVNGAQGTGKSTICLFLKLLLEAQYQLRCVVLSIDDFYLSHNSRQHLAASAHPLLATRGVPGTHNVTLAMATIQSLLNGEAVALPQFSKATDDVLPEADWPIQQQPVDIILFEGWCVGAIPQADEALIKPINQLEKDEDSDGLWRTTINRRLAGDYQDWFALIDMLVMLKAPSMDIIFQWRSLQEQKLAAKTAEKEGSRIMNAEQIKRFIQHYERLSVYMMEEMPDRAEIVLTLDLDHHVVSSSGLNEETPGLDT
jgi:D-glycerate 3-kinase